MSTNREALFDLLSTNDDKPHIEVADLILESKWLKEIRKQAFEEGRDLGFTEGVSDANDEDPWTGKNPYA